LYHLVIMIDKRVFEFPIHYTTVIGQIAIGWGAHETVADECKAANVKKVLITTTGLNGTGIVDEIKQILMSHGISIEIFDRVTPNPKDYEVMEAYKVFKETGCDGVVSVGGGSSHDCGKGVRIVNANDGRNINDFVARLDPPWMETIKTLKPVTVPQITVNTTAGTGAESTAVAAIINTRTRAKGIIMSPGLAPRVALIDPMLVRLMPQRFIAWTGFDALAHAFESFISRMRSQYNSAIMLRAIKLVAENLREFTYNRMNHVACENMCWAENMAGVGIGFGGGVGLVHGLGHGLSSLYDVHHGLANAVVTLPLERYNESACPEKFAEMAAAMGVDTKGMSKIQAADKWFDEMERLLKDLNIETGNLNRQFGFQKTDVEHVITNQYANDFAREGNPRDFNYEDCVKLLEDLV
jgi:methanol:N,N-dimethyl-4-nitrosoaniline oxidoreductase